MYDVVDTETGEVYGSYETADEAFSWIEKIARCQKLIIGLAILNVCITTMII